MGAGGELAWGGSANRPWPHLVAPSGDAPRRGGRALHQGQTAGAGLDAGRQGDMAGLGQHGRRPDAQVRGRVKGAGVGGLGEEEGISVSRCLKRRSWARRLRACAHSAQPLWWVGTVWSAHALYAWVSRGTLVQDGLWGWRGRPGGVGRMRAAGWVGCVGDGCPLGPHECKNMPGATQQSPP
jgi:hypothetical protein